MMDIAPIIPTILIRVGVMMILQIQAFIIPLKRNKGGRRIISRESHTITMSIATIHLLIKFLFAIIHWQTSPPVPKNCQEELIKSYYNLMRNIHYSSIARKHIW